MTSIELRTPRWKPYLVWCCVALLAAIFVGPALWSGTRDWQPVDAEVTSTSIESSRPGTPAWSLMIDFDYEVDGVRYQKRKVDVFHDADRSIVESRQTEWHAGKRFEIYYDQDDPDWFSLSPDQDFEALVVMALLLMVITAAVLLPFYLAWRRKHRRSAAGRRSDF